MDLKKKKVIAREFLFFLICIIIGLLSYGSMHSYNFIKKKNIAKLNHQLKIKQAELDSLRKSIDPRVDEFGIPIKKKVVANGKHFTFDYNVTNEQISEAIDEYFSKNNSGREVDAFKKFGGEMTSPPSPKKRKISTENLTLDEVKKRQLDKNIREALANGASNEEVEKYAIAFKNKFGVRKQISGNVDDLPSLKDLGLEKSVATLNQKINSLQKQVNTIWFIKKEESRTILTSDQINQVTLNIFLICLALVFGLRYLSYAINWSIKTIKS